MLVLAVMLSGIAIKALYDDFRLICRNAAPALLQSWISEKRTNFLPPFRGFMLLLRIALYRCVGGRTTMRILEEGRKLDLPIWPFFKLKGPFFHVLMHIF